MLPEVAACSTLIRLNAWYTVICPDRQCILALSSRDPSTVAETTVTLE